MRPFMRLLCGLAALLFCSAASVASTILQYSGTDISAGNGTLTITCNDSTLGNIWQVAITRSSSGYMATMSNFEDLKDPGVGGVHFNYSGGNWLMICHYEPGTSGSNTYTGTFAQVHRGTDYYSYSMTVVNTLSGANQWSQVATYTINPATTATTHFQCVVQTTNISGSTQTSQTWMSSIFEGICGLDCQAWDYAEGGVLSSYQGSSPNHYQQQMESNGTTPAIWQTTDNLNGTNPDRQAGSAAWGQGVVMNDAYAVTTQGLTAGRTFYFDSDVNNNSTSSSQFAAALPSSNSPEWFYIWPTNWGIPSSWANNYTYTHTYDLYINIVGSSLPTAVPGVDNPGLTTSDVAIVASSNNPSATTSVTMDGSDSTAGSGDITDYTWTWTDSVWSSSVGNGVTTQHSIDSHSTATQAVALYSGLYDGFQNVNNGINDITLTITNSSGQKASATIRVWIYPTPTYWVATTGSDTNSGTQSLPFKTINKGITAAKSHPGDVVMVMPGTYYESDSFQGNGNSTAPGASTCGQITLMGMPTFPQQQSNNVIMDASDPLVNWTQCPSTLNGVSVPNYTHIWYTNVAQVAGVNTNINWASTHVTQYNPTSGATTELVCASVPLASGNASTTGGTPYEITGGYYLVTGGTANTQIIDTTHLANQSSYPNGYFNGGNVVFQETVTGSPAFSQITGLTVSSFVSSTGTLNVTGPAFTAPNAGYDSYVILNLPQLMHIAGTYADVLNASTGVYTIYVWTTDSSNPSTDGYVITAGHRGLGLGVGYPCNYWTADNIEVRHAESTGSGSTGFGTASTSTTTAGFIYQNCLADHINTYPFYMDNSSNCIITRCTSVYNHDGMEAVSCANALIQYCECGWCWEDGIRLGGSADSLPYDGDTETVDSTYVHDCSSYNHADGIQTWNYLTGLTVTNTLLVNVGDELQSQDTQYITWNNNIAIGSATNGIYPQGDNNTLEANTVLGTVFLASNGESYSKTQNWTFMNNVVSPLGVVRTLSNIPTGSSSFNSDYNDWFEVAGYGYSPVVDSLISNAFNVTWAQYQTASLQDVHSYGNCLNGASISPNPLFTNVPKTYSSITEADYYSNTPTTIYIASVAGMSVNDYIEIDWDGVQRQITAVNSTNGYITFTPADNAVSEGYLPTGVADWGSTAPSSMALNLAFQTGSPAIGTSSTAGNMGSSINMANWLYCDFHATGRRETPADPTP